MPRPLDDSRRTETANVLTFELSERRKTLVLRAEFVFFEHSDPAINGTLFRHPTPAWTRVFIISAGWAEITIAGAACRLTAPGIYLIPTGCAFTARYGIVDMHVFHLDLTDLCGASLTAGVDSLLMLKDRDVVAATAALCRSGATAVCQSAIFHLVLRLLAPHLPRIQADQVEFGPFRQLAELIRSSVQDGLGIPDFARVMGLPQAVLVRRFRRTCGMPLRTYIASLRMDAARRMLAYGDAEVETIADRLGFSDRFYFYRCFRRHAGMAPLEYRLRHRVHSTPAT